GQPWLVNALAYQACFRDVTDRTQPISLEVMERSRNTLILRQDTHLDVLINRLKEPRVRTIIDAIISSKNYLIGATSDDIKYAEDLGLIRKSEKDFLIANPIYQEILPRALTAILQRNLH